MVTAAATVKATTTSSRIEGEQFEELNNSIRIGLGWELREKQRAIGSLFGGEIFVYRYYNSRGL